MADTYVFFGGKTGESTGDKSHRLLDEDKSVAWSANHGDTVLGVAVKGDFFYTAGNRTSSITTRKYDVDGNEITDGDWPVDHGAAVYCIAVDSAGNVYTGGARVSNVTTRKYNSSGTLQWSADHGAAVYCIAVDSAGNVYTGGLPVSNVKIRKYDSGGNVDAGWNLTWATGGGYPEQIYAMCVDASYLYATKYRGSSDLNTIRKYRLSDAGVEWSKAIELVMAGVAVDSSGNVYICGERNFGNYHLFKLNSSGTTVWSKDPGGYGSLGTSVAVDSAGYVYAGVSNKLYQYTNNGASSPWNYDHGWNVYAVAVGPAQIAQEVPGLALPIALGTLWNTVYDVAPALALPLALAAPSSLTPDPPDLQSLTPAETAVYTGVVTGSGAMLFLPLAAIECRRERGQSTWLIVRTTYTPALYAALPARIGAELIVFAGILGGTSSGIFLRSVLTDVAYTRSPQGGELRLTGRVQTPSYSAATRALTGLQSLQTVDGRRTVRCDVDPLLRPSDTATWNDDSWTVGIIQYEITPQDAWMRVTEAA